MKVLNGISIVAILLAGAATPSFATPLLPGTVVTPGIVPNAAFTGLAATPDTTFSFGGDTGHVLEFVGNFAGNPFGANDISFMYEIQVTGGDIVNLTSQSFAIPGIMIDVAQINAPLAASFGAGPYTPAATASLTSDGKVVGFGFTPPNGLTAGMTSYTLLINTNLTNFQPGVFSLQDGQTQNFDGFVPAATPEPGSLMLLGTGLLGLAGAARRRLVRK